MLCSQCHTLAKTKSENLSNGPYCVLNAQNSHFNPTVAPSVRFEDLLLLSLQVNRIPILWRKCRYRTRTRPRKPKQTWWCYKMFDEQNRREEESRIKLKCQISFHSAFIAVKLVLKILAPGNTSEKASFGPIFKNL